MDARYQFAPILEISLFQSVPGVGDDKKDDDGMTREEQQEQERMR